MLAPDVFRLFFSKYKLLLLVIVEVEVARIRLGNLAFIPFELFELDSHLINKAVKLKSFRRHLRRIVKQVEVALSGVAFKKRTLDGDAVHISARHPAGAIRFE